MLPDPGRCELIGQISAFSQYASKDMPAGNAMEFIWW
jgi:hypothetical protein